MSSAKNETVGESAGGLSNEERRAWSCLWEPSARQSLPARHRAGSGTVSLSSSPEDRGPGSPCRPRQPRGLFKGGPSTVTGIGHAAQCDALSVPRRCWSEAHLLRQPLLLVHKDP